MASELGRTPGDASPSEDRIRALLRGDPAEVAAGVNWVDRMYRRQACGLLRRHFPELAAADLPEIWKRVLSRLQTAADDGWPAQPFAPLSGIVWNLAVGIAQDWLRAQPGWSRLEAALSQFDSDGALPRQWKMMTAVQRTEVLDMISQAVAGLPTPIQLVWRLYAAHYPKATDAALLTEILNDLQDGPSDSDLRCRARWSREEVEHALALGRQEVREHLKRKGYEL